MLSVGVPLENFPFVDVVVRAYRKWEEENYPQHEVRVGVSAETMLAVYQLGMESVDLRTVRDCAALTFAYCFNGLRESSTMSLKESNVSISAEAMTTRVSIWKGRSASQEQLLGFRRQAQLTSPVDVVARWAGMRPKHPRFFALSGESEVWEPQSLTAAMTRVFTLLQVSPPPNGKFTSHSLRIGAHTEQVLLGIPLEARMARFGWKHNSASMAALYFDRTITVTAASYWFFGQHSVPPAAAEL